MAFFSADEFDRSSIGNPWNVAAFVMLLLVVFACLLLIATPMGGPLVPYPGPSYGYNAMP
jgi:hypothetical protein